MTEIRVGNKVLITVKTASERFGISRNTIARAIAKGEITCIRVGRYNFVSPTEIAAWKRRRYRADMAARVQQRWQRAKEHKRKR